MKIIRLEDDNKILEATAVAIGKFDGIHRGHIKLLERLKMEKENGLQTVVFSFDKSIASFFSGIDVPMLQTDGEKEEFLAEFGIDILAIYPVNEDSVKISPEEFIKKILYVKLNAKVIVAGPDLSYADKGMGNFELLDSLSEKYSYTTVMIEKEIYEPLNAEISSTLVREAVVKGEMELSKELLGRNYSISGKVIHGRRLGRKMSFPTVNLIAEKNKLLPPFGVYTADVYVGSNKFCGVANVGIKPTVSDNDMPCVETHIFDFDEDLYGEYIKVELKRFLREEKKFGSIEELKQQLAKDVEMAKRDINI